MRSMVPTYSSPLTLGQCAQLSWQEELRPCMCLPERTLVHAASSAISQVLLQTKEIQRWWAASRVTMKGWAFDLPLILWIPEQEEEEFRHRKHLDVFGGAYRGSKSRLPGSKH